MVFLVSRTGRLVVLGTVGVAIGFAVTGPSRLVGVAGFGLVVIGLVRRGNSAVVDAARTSADVGVVRAEADRLRVETDRLRADLLAGRARVDRREEWRLRGLVVSGRRPTIQVHSHHKAASKFTGMLLKDLARRNDLRMYSDYTSRIDLAGALTAHDIVFLRNCDRQVQMVPEAGGLHIVRNPLALVVSAYFSHLRIHKIDLANGRWKELAVQRTRLERLSESEGIHATIEFLLESEFCEGMPGPLLSLERWDYDDPRFTNVRMEDLVSDPVGILASVFALDGLELPDSADHMFAARSGGRRPGEVDPYNHYRSGDPDDWRRHLDDSHVASVLSACPGLVARFYPEIESPAETPASGAGGR